MIQKDNIDELFDGLKGQWDTEVPATGHEARFLDKLNAQQGTVSIKTGKSKTSFWRNLSIAASVAVLFTIGIQIFNSMGEKAETTPNNIKETKFYFASLIEKEMEKIEAETTPETQHVVADAMEQIKKLEKNYAELENDLAEEGNTRQILNAMIINFQTRINLLQEVLDQIEEIKLLKHPQNENHIV
ncbi:hypothetical protein OOZ15_04440 [Galbibacter sp. EGI 63066]|uniref:hypothetical protein n=1 Tax=Galbibacter sp. EGI 63066 TaxID=2993559 RepID=UPI0022498545|nr:hypothetical protein [Galbibacter sp. EGI 63066]MCX2679181.1 hypothetical protein [Galbibacter sp. EGI 63066]